MSFFDRLAAHITPLTLICLLGAMAAAGWFGIVAMLLRGYVVDAWYWARRRYLAVRGDAFADEPHPLAGWPTDIGVDDQPATLQPIGPDETRWRTRDEWAALQDLFDNDWRAYRAQHEPGRRD